MGRVGSKKSKPISTPQPLWSGKNPREAKRGGARPNYHPYAQGCIRSQEAEVYGFHSGASTNSPQRFWPPSQEASLLFLLQFNQVNLANSLTAFLIEFA